MRTTIMTQTTSRSTSTRTSTRASCTCEHALRARSLRCTPLDVVSHAPHGSRCSSLTSSHPHTWASLLDLAFLPFYFDLTFTVLFHFSVLMHPEQHTELDTWSPCNTTWAPPRRGVTTPTTSPSPSQKQCLVVWWNLMNPQGNEWNLLYLKNMKITLQAKFSLRWAITNWFTNDSYASSNEDSGCKCAVNKEWKKLETIPANGNVKSKKGGYSGSTKRQKESPLCHIDGHMSPHECGVGTKITQVQRQS